MNSHRRMIAPLITAAVIAAWASTPALGNILPYGQHFDALSPGNLTGQDSWTNPADNSWVVTSGTGISGTNSARATMPISSPVGIVTQFRNIRPLSGTLNVGDHVIFQARVKAGEHEDVAVGFTSTSAGAYTSRFMWLRIYNNAFAGAFKGFQMEFNNGGGLVTQGTLGTGTLTDTGYYWLNIDWLVGTNFTFNIKDSANNPTPLFSGVQADTISGGDRPNWAGVQIFVQTDGRGTATADLDNLTVNGSIPEPASLALLALGALTLSRCREKCLWV